MSEGDPFQIRGGYGGVSLEWKFEGYPALRHNLLTSNLGAEQLTRKDRKSTKKNDVTERHFIDMFYGMQKCKTPQKGRLC